MGICVLGATGGLGSRIARSLLDQGLSPSDLIAGARSPAKASPLAALGAAVRLADYDRAETLPAALRGAEVLMLVPSFAEVEARIVQYANVLRAAASSGVRRVVLTGFAASRPESRFLIAPFYAYAESKLRLSGMEWTILRNGMYLDPLADWAPALAASGRLPYPVRKGRVAYVGRDDLARASAAACLHECHAGQAYDLTGPAALSMPELAAALSDATGQRIDFRSATEDEFRAICREDGLGAGLTETLVSMYRAVDAGEFETVSDDIRLLTGRPAQAAASYLREALEVWRVERST